MSVEKHIYSNTLETFGAHLFGRETDKDTTWVIEGFIPKGANLSVVGNLFINGQILDDGVIKATGNISVRKKIGAKVTLEGKSITAYDVGEGTILTATQGDIETRTLANKVTLSAQGGIHFASTGDYLHATAVDNITFDAIGDHATLDAEHLYGNKIGTNAVLTTTKGNVLVKTVGANAHHHILAKAEPSPTVAAKTILLQNPTLKNIIYDIEHEFFLIPRDFEPAMQNSTLVDALRDAGGIFHTAPDLDPRYAAYVTLPDNLNKDEKVAMWGKIKNIVNLANNRTGKQAASNSL